MVKFTTFQKLSKLSKMDDALKIKKFYQYHKKLIILLLIYLVLTNFKI